MNKGNVRLGQLVIQAGIYVCLLVIIGLLAGCATVDQEQAEYERVEYLETVFKPGVAQCQTSGGHLVYDGPYSQRMRRILDTQDWDKLHRIETIHFACARNR